VALYFLVGLSLLFALRAFVGWRAGIALMIVLAAVQDPLRKLVPGTPGWLALATVPVFVAALLTCATRTKSFWGEFRLCYPWIGRTMLLLALLCLPAAWLSASYGRGSWIMTIFGAFSYSVIFLCIIAGFHYPRRLAELRWLLALYCVFHGVMLTGTLLEYFKWFPDAQVIGSKALGFQWVRRHAGYSVDLIAGFYRSADVMGWHAAAVTMICLLLAYTGKGRRRIAWALLSIIAISALLMCGRRKMVYMLPVFFVALAWIYWNAGRASKIIALAGVLLLPLGTAWFVGDLLSEDSSNIRYYAESSDETLDRLEVHGFGSLVGTYRQTGFFGSGLGVATPGVHHLDVERPRAWQESGTSRVLVELGVPGAIGMLLVMTTIVLSLWQVTLRQVRQRAPSAPYAAGLLAFFLANVGSLIVSGQILADPFIAAFIGFSVGLNLSVIRLQKAARPMPRQKVPQPEPPTEALEPQVIQW
jgi:hypothetical protein